MQYIWVEVYGKCADRTYDCAFWKTVSEHARDYLERPKAHVGILRTTGKDFYEYIIEWMQAIGIN